MSMSQNDVKRALLGDHEAAKRLTEAGVREDGSSRWDDSGA